MYCKKCGKAVENDLNYCTNCGANLKVMKVESHIEKKFKTYFITIIYFILILLSYFFRDYSTVSFILLLIAFFWIVSGVVVNPNSLWLFLILVLSIAFFVLFVIYVSLSSATCDFIPISIDACSSLEFIFNY